MTNYSLTINIKVLPFQTISAGLLQQINNSARSYIKQVTNGIGLKSFNVAIFLKSDTKQPYNRPTRPHVWTHLQSTGTVKCECPLQHQKAVTQDCIYHFSNTLTDPKITQLLLLLIYSSKLGSAFLYYLFLALTMARMAIPAVAKLLFIPVTVNFDL